MLKKIEVIRQVLASAARAKLPRAEEAMDALSDINVNMLELKSLNDEAIQYSINKKYNEDVCNGDIHG